MLAHSTHTLSAKSRLDLDGGHIIPGPDNVGFIEIIPDDETGKYLSQLTRYGTGESGFEFAFPLEARYSNNSTRYIPVGSRENNATWVEIINVGANTATNALKIYSESGVLLYDNPITNNPKSQTHI